MSAAAVLALLAACPHDRGTTTRVDPPRATAHPDAAPSPPAHPSEAECAQLVQHVIALELHDPATAKPADRTLTDADVASVAQNVGSAAQATCRAMSIATFRCALAAATVDALAACDG